MAKQTRVICIILASMLAVSMTACGTSENTVNTETTASAESSESTNVNSEDDMKEVQDAAYALFSEESNPECYISKPESIMSYKTDILKYSKNRLVLIAADGTTYEDVEALASEMDASICGYIKAVDLYQLQLNGEYDYESLNELSEKMEENDLVIDCHIETIDVFPVDEEVTTIDEENEMWNSSGFNVEDNSFTAAGVDGIRKYNDQMNPVKIGMLDYPVDYTNDDLNVENSDEYTTDFIYDSRNNIYAHGTEVAGIISAIQNNDTGIDGICPSASLYSYNAADQSVSLRAATLVKMITEDQVRIINFSIAYLKDFSIGAQIGNENAITYIQEEKDFYSALFNKLLDNGYDFLICQAAGNENGKSIIRDENEYFGFRFIEEYETGGEYIDDLNAKNAFFTSNMDDERLQKHIIVVGAYDTNFQEVALFSNVGERVDILAPGMGVKTTYPMNVTIPTYGTSIATPFVTGTAACMFALNENLTAEEVKTAIINSATEEISGYPILNVEKAVESVLGNSTESVGN